MNHILFGGDKLTALSGQAIRQNSESGHSQLEDLEPTIEDWHAKMCLMRYAVCAINTLTAFTIIPRWY